MTPEEHKAMVHYIKSAFNEWFDTHLAGKVVVDKSDLVAMEGYGLNDTSRKWFTTQEPRMMFMGDKTGDFTHKAYLIKSSIEAIKKESCEDVLMDIVNNYVSVNETFEGSIMQMINRAKAALATKEESDR